MCLAITAQCCGYLRDLIIFYFNDTLPPILGFYLVLAEAMRKDPEDLGSLRPYITSNITKLEKRDTEFPVIATVVATVDSTSGPYNTVDTRGYNPSLKDNNKDISDRDSLRGLFLDNSDSGYNGDYDTLGEESPLPIKTKAIEETSLPYFLSGI
ncbi:hypothetical protein TEQG_03711 [Trichophyton equinum CBS 127.97]|uniref:Uncharacterized protein n=1 Tax=Trichophyton equinum (strain ATCC MYA-4606 / CBS 127.97) TaxID=559882 RepID=F2PSK1_TRIEC|nr:hypothetical protein TEQG_03711 [Trichophyton equinum CBS 127.97]